ncbi:hypothetical protein BC830DRAFT_1134141 [Chytriomyces sp. MP71]|nr:hypothetical protein BC830DRAFT_1134141 [Chytriomyces sp. MP71]
MVVNVEPILSVFTPPYIGGVAEWWYNEAEWGRRNRGRASIACGRIDSEEATWCAINEQCLVKGIAVTFRSVFALLQMCGFSRPFNVHALALNRAPLLLRWGREGNASCNHYRSTLVLNYTNAAELTSSMNAFKYSFSRRALLKVEIFVGRAKSG